MTDYTAHDIHLIDQGAVDALRAVDALAADPETARRLAERGEAVYGAELTADLHNTVDGRPMSLAGWAAFATIRLVQAQARHTGDHDKAARMWAEDVDMVWAKVAEAEAELEKLRAELADVRNQAHRDQQEHQQVLRDKTALAAQVDAMRAVVDAAKVWRAQFAKPAATKLPRMAALIAAVDGLPTERDEPTEQQYLIWSHKQDAWWGPGGHGYRWDIARAGRFPLDRAEDHASTRSWPADRKLPPEVIIPAPPLHILNDPERIGGWIDEQIKAATDAKVAARQAEKTEAVAR